MLYDFNFCITYMYIYNCVQIIFKKMVYYNYLVLFLLCAVHLMLGFIYEKMLQGNYNYSQDRSFLTGNEENPALLLSNVHNRTSARDGPMFGSMGLSMNTNSLLTPSIGKLLIHRDYLTIQMAMRKSINQLLAPLEVGHDVDISAKFILFRLPVCKCQCCQLLADFPTRPKRGRTS